MDTIFIRELRIEAVIGLWEWEQRIRQVISLDLELAADIRRTAATDSIPDTLNYKAIAKRLIAFVEESRFQLVESLAQAIGELLMAEFSVSWLRLSVHKPGALRGARDVGVTIERGKRSE